MNSYTSCLLVAFAFIQVFGEFRAASASAPVSPNMVRCDIKKLPVGFARAQEIGGTNCLVLQQDAVLGSISTVVLRGSTDGFLDDVERAVNNAINTYKSLCRDSRMLAGGGAPEVELARQVGEACGWTCRTVLTGGTWWLRIERVGDA